MKPLIYTLSMALFAGSALVAQDAGQDSRAAEQGNEGQVTAEEATEQAEATGDATIPAVPQTDDALSAPADEATQDAEANSGTPEVEAEVRETQEEMDETAPAAEATVDADADTNVEAEARNNRRTNRNQQPQADVEADANADATVDSETDINADANANAEAEARTDRRMNRNQRSQADAEFDARGNTNQLGIFLNADASNGVVIDRVAPNSPAARLGLRSGDRIETFNNQRYANRSAFNRAIRTGFPNNSVPVTYWRDGQQYSGTIQVDAWNNPGQRTYEGQAPQNLADRDRVQPQPYTAARPIYDDGYSQGHAGYQGVNPCGCAVIEYDPCQTGYGHGNWHRSRRDIRRAHRFNRYRW